MQKNTKQRVVVTGALLTVPFLCGVLLTGTLQAQSAQPYMPDPGWQNGMMGHGMMGYGRGMQAGMPLTKMATYGHCGCGMMGYGMMSQGMMGYDSGTSVTLTDMQDAALVSVPESFTAAVESADPNRGQQLTAANTCLGCHTLSPNQTMVGPTWHDLAKTAATRVAGQTAAEYLYSSILDPNAYVVKGYQPNVMIQGYSQTLREQDIADIVSYLLTLHR